MVLKKNFLDISPEEMQRYYRGEASNVVTIADDQTRLQFSAKIIRQFVTVDGVKGRFEIEYDRYSKLIGISKLS
jgi:hypothetical protein